MASLARRSGQATMAAPLQPVNTLSSASSAMRRPSARSQPGGTAVFSVGRISASVSHTPAAAAATVACGVRGKKG